MVDLFLRFFNLSVSASWLVLAVLAVRLLLDRLKAPKWTHPLLWAVVGLRLALPFSIPSPLSLIPSAQTLSPHTVHYDPAPTIQSGIRVINNAVNPVLSEAFAAPPVTSVNPLDTAVFLFSLLWVSGMAALALYALVSYLRLRARVRTAVLFRDNIYQSETVVSPFVLGLFRPKIYLPFQMAEGDMAHVIAHEEAHLRRWDHWIKPLGFLLLTLYWFNPLLWAAYALLCRDLELACDERVVRTMDPAGRADYAQALLTCAHPRHVLQVCPLAFGEVGIKARIKGILNYKKPAFWAAALALILCAVLAVCFLTDPAPEEEPQPSAPVQAQTPEPAASFRPVMWFDRLATGTPVLGGPFTLEQFPGVTFRYGEYRLEVEEDGETVTLYTGMPIESLYLADLTGDDKPEFCSTVLFGSGMVDSRILVYDYAAGTLYELSDRGEYDYSLSLEGETLTATRSAYATTKTGGSLTGPLVLQDGALSLLAPTAPEGASLAEAFEGLYPVYVYNNTSGDYDNTISTLASEILGMREDPEAGTGTVYTLRLDRSYAIDLNDGEPRLVSSFYTPFSYTFEKDENGQYVLKETWQPAGGEGLADDIRAKFPPDLAEKALHSEDYEDVLGKQCEAQFWYIYEYDPRTLESRVTALLTTICSSPAASSRPGDYIETHRAEYDKLLSYGDDALTYLYNRFLNGAPTGLSGQIMCSAMKDLLGEEAPTQEADTPQAYFDALLSQARALLEEHGVSYITENYPKSLRLLILTGDFQASLGLPGATVFSYTLDGTHWVLEKDGKHFVVMEENSTHFALEEDGTGWAWGSNTYDQLDNVTDRLKAVASDGTTWVWGTPTYGQLSDATVYTWGSNTYGQSGDGTGWSWGSSPAPEETAGPE